MNDLFRVAVDALGGLSRWNELKSEGKLIDRVRNLARNG